MQILAHPDLDDTIRVPDSSAEVLRRSGWRDAPAAAVLEEVGDDPDLAAAALEAEKAGPNRKTVKQKLVRTAGQ